MGTHSIDPGMSPLARYSVCALTPLHYVVLNVFTKKTAISARVTALFGQ